MLRKSLPEKAYRGYHRPLHLVVDHPLEDQRRSAVGRIRKFKTVPFLGKIEFIKTREKDRVKIDIQKVEKILTVLTRKRVRGPVTAGKSVHKSIQ